MLPAWMITDIKRKDDEEIGRHIGDEDEANYRSPPSSDSSDDTDSDDVVLKCGSGGGPSPPPAPDPMAESLAQSKLEQTRHDMQEADRVAQEARDKQTAADKETAYQGRLGGAYATAQNYGSDRLRQLGIDDTYGIGSAYSSALNKARGSVPDLDPNPGSYFGNDLFDTALSDVRGQQRNRLTHAYDQAVPSDFQTQYIPDTADDALINSIIGGQYTDADAALRRAQARGTLNDTGFNTAESNLANQRTGAIARANTMGQGVLATGRQQLSDIDKNARQGITNWDFGDTYDPNAAVGRLRAGADQFNTGLEGNLRNAFGSTNFFDTDALIAQGGKAQGSVNPGASALQDAITEEEKRRTAGSVGAF